MITEEAISHIRDILAENNPIKPSMVVFESEKEALYMAIKALEQTSYKSEARRWKRRYLDLKHRIFKLEEQQPCEDCISRKDVLAMKRLFIDEDGVMAYAVPTGNILRLQPVTPTRPTGKWIDIGDEGLVFKCSLCGLKKTIESHFCPNCGAKMEEI